MLKFYPKILKKFQVSFFVHASVLIVGLTKFIATSFVYLPLLSIQQNLEHSYAGRNIASFS